MQLVAKKLPESQPSKRRWKLSGFIEEHAEESLKVIADDLAGATSLDLDMADVSMINSIGLVRWVAFLKSIPSACSYSFSEAPEALVTFANLMSKSLGVGSITSVRVPYTCDDCGHRFQTSLDVKAGIQLEEFPTHTCDKCGSPTQSLCFPSDYLAFAKS